MELTTSIAVEAVAWGRAPRYESKHVNRRVECADGFKISVQASPMHYAEDSHESKKAAYWRGLDAEPVYPFTSFEVGYASEEITGWDEHDSGGVWSWVPREKVAKLLDEHGGAIKWEEARA